MMAMTPQDKKQLDEIERAFLEVVEPTHVVPVKTKPSSNARRGWLGGLKERIVMKFVCCAPPQTLLDDDEILEILAKVEEPVKPTKLPPPVLRAPSLKRRNSASIVPFSTPTVVEKESVDDAEVPQVTNKTVHEPVAQPEEEKTDAIAVESKQVPSPRLAFISVQFVVVSVLKLHNDVRSRHTERAALAIQSRWRNRKLTTELTIAPSTEPDHEPESSQDDQHPTELTPVFNDELSTDPSPVFNHQLSTVSTPVFNDQEAIVPSSVSLVRRTRMIRSPKTKSIKCNPAAKEVRHAIESITQLAMTRKRLRSVDVESSLIPVVDVERNVHVLFGEEVIDDEDDEEDEDLIGELLLAPVSPLRAAHPMFAIIPRCVSVPPPPPTVRPQPKKSQTLINFKAATTIQNAWRRFKLNQEREIQRRVQQYEVKNQSVMPTIRSKMADLRRRLEELQAQTTVPVETCQPSTLSDDDFDWL